MPITTNMIVRTLAYNMRLRSLRSEFPGESFIMKEGDVRRLACIGNSNPAAAQPGVARVGEDRASIEWWPNT
jgi:hypothetical protein